MGDRLMWTSNTDMKIDTRLQGPGGRPPSPASCRGTSTSEIWQTSPSAGDTINPAPRGVTRTGSRKNAATHNVTPAISQASTCQKWPLRMKPRVKVIAAEMATNLIPSGWTDGIRYLTVSGEALCGTGVMPLQ